MSYYKPCPDCGANLDPGERCDCKEDPHIMYTEHSTCDCTKIRAMKVSEALTIGIDISNGTDISCISVGRRTGDEVEIINVFVGEEAEWMYNKLTTTKNNIKIQEGHIYDRNC